MKKAGRLPLYPLLLAVFPVVHIYSRNTGSTTFADVLRPAACCLALGVVVMVIASLLTRDRVKAGIGASVFLMLFLSYGHLLRVGDRVIGNFSTFRLALHPWACFWAWAVIALILLVTVARTRKDLSRIAQFLVVMSLALTAVAMASALVSRVTTRPEQAANTDGWDRMIAQERAAAKNLHAPANKPDIYYIILDAYARQDVLKRDYHYDNSEFLGRLTRKGFYIAKRSRCNYPCTQFSLPTALNHDYLKTLMGYVKGPRDLSINKAIGDSKLPRVLQTLGYQYVFLGSGWSVTSQCFYADLKPTRGAFTYTELESTLVRGSVLGVLSATSPERTLRNGTLSQFEELSEIPLIIEPTFTFAHIMCPHDPWLFDSKGNRPADVFTDNPESTRAAYVEQVRYLNKRVEKLVDTILARSSTPPIIVIQSDHGPLNPELLTRWITNGNIKGPDGKTKLDVTDRIGILNAYYLPGDGRKCLYDTITPVNTWRIVLNHYFGANMDLLKDTTYAPTNTWICVGGAFDIKDFRLYTKPD